MGLIEQSGLGRADRILTAPERRERVAFIDHYHRHPTPEIAARKALRPHCPPALCPCGYLGGAPLHYAPGYCYADCPYREPT